jgi:hypothetical protein
LIVVDRQIRVALTWRMLCSAQGTDMIGTTAKTERELRRRAITEAAELFRADGAAAVGAVLALAKDQSKTIDERRFDRLTLLELERLDRLETERRASQALTLWKPALFSVAGIAALLGITTRLRRRR